MAKRRIKRTTPHDSPGTLVFWSQRSPQNSIGVTPTGAPNAGGVGQNRWLSTNNRLYLVKKLSYRRGTSRCVMSIEILPVATQQCRNHLYDKSWPNWWHEVGDLVRGNAWQTMCTQPWRDRVGFHCLKCHKQTNDVELCMSPYHLSTDD